MRNKRVISDFWVENFLDKKTSLCGLCGNSGIIDTTNTAISHAGVRPGGKYYCLCPNGRAMKEAQQVIQPDSTQ